MYRIIPHFTASPLQATSYLGGIALFSIAFLVFLNATISFVITDVIGQEHRVGSAVGNLGFADELVALVACPLWGLVSDRIGVRWVAVSGYLIIAFSLVCLVQSARVYPDLIIWRMVFSLGAAACTTMVTAVLPAMTAKKGQGQENGVHEAHFSNVQSTTTSKPNSNQNPNRNSGAPSVSSELTITPVRFHNRSGSGSSSPLLARYRRKRRPTGLQDTTETTSDPDMDTSRIAGFVGMFTGIGALIALAVLLPLPATLGKDLPRAQAVQNSFYIVGAVALCVAAFVSFGLRGLAGEQDKGLRQLFGASPRSKSPASGLETGTTPISGPTTPRQPSYLSLIRSALVLGVRDQRIALGYAGGFVARASSVGVSLFIPLYVNAYFIRNGRCDAKPGEELRSSCQEAYRTASMLTGISQLAALLAAPLYGFFSAQLDRKRNSRAVLGTARGRKVATRLPLAVAAVCGVLGNAAFATLKTPVVTEKGGHGAVIAVVLIGLGQIGAIVCSLGILAQGIRNAHPPGYGGAAGINGAAGGSDAPAGGAIESPLPNGGGGGGSGGVSETAPLLPQPESGGPFVPSLTNAVDGQGDGDGDRAHLKGTVAGVYSLAGGAAILLLTKLGGYLFDATSAGAPFFLLAGFNAALLLIVLLLTGVSAFEDRATGGGHAG